jgi:hypothetical protein
MHLKRTVSYLETGRLVEKYLEIRGLVSLEPGARSISSPVKMLPKRLGIPKYHGISVHSVYIILKRGVDRQISCLVSLIAIRHCSLVLYAIYTVDQSAISPNKVLCRVKRYRSCT